MNKTKGVIFDSAMKIFSDCGYDGATMDDIALDAGVAKGTLYYHFKSKEEIFKFVISEGMQLIKEDIEIETAKVQDPIDKLKVLCNVQLSLVYQQSNFFKVVMSQLWGKEIRQLELRMSIKKYISIIENFIEVAKENGKIRDGETSFMAYTFFGALCSAAIYEIVNTDKKSKDEVLENLIQSIFHGILV
jgi:AcrR family transcriptional regulator